MSLLANTVESVSQSVRGFAADLTLEEREAAFKSNQVFPQLVQTLGRCRQVIDKYRHRLPELSDCAKAPEIQDHSRRRSFVDSARGLYKEGAQMMSTKLGHRGLGLFRLPEDELATMRQASKELLQVVPQLSLAIQVYNQRGQKRSASEACGLARPSQAQRRSASDVSGADAAAGPVPLYGAGIALEDCKDVLPLRLQLVSNALAARSCGTLPSLTAQELRRAPNIATSSSSLDVPCLERVASPQGPEKGENVVFSDASEVVRLVFGRQEVRGKVPKSLSLPAGVHGTPQPMWRFISRDMIALEVPRPQVATIPESETLVRGTQAITESQLDTLPLVPGCGFSMEKSSAPQPLAYASGLTSGGMHVQKARETRWRYLAKGSKEAVDEGDVIALLLESPPGSSNPVPTRDLMADEVICLLGLELHRL